MSITGSKMASNDSAWGGVEKLRGSENYHTWKFAIKNLLELNDYAKCIQATNAGACLETDPDKLRKSKARIELSVATSVYVHIENSGSTLETWTKLQALYQDKGLSRRIGLLRKLVTIRLENCESMNEYVSQTFETANKLNGIGFPVADEWLGSILLAGLPSSFEPMIMGLESSSAVLTADSIKSKLLESNYGASEQSQAFFGKSGKKNIKCYSCGQRGHIAAKCTSKNNGPHKYGQTKQEPWTGGSKNKKSNATAKCAFVAEAQVASAAYFTKRCERDEWYIDSGASQHMSPFEDLFTKLKPSRIAQIKSVSSSSLQVKGVGDIAVCVNDIEIDFKDVLCVPGLSANLLSVAQMVKNGNEVAFNQRGCRVYNCNGELIIDIKSENGIYKIQAKQAECLAAISQMDNGMLWHRKLGHVNYADLCKMRNGLVDGVDFGNQYEVEIKNCEVCKEGKQTRQPFQRSVNRCDNILDLIHSDLNGPMQNKSIGGAKYILTFIDDHSRKMFVYFIKEKSEVFNRFVEFKAMVENETGKRIKALRSDNGTEYVNEAFQSYFKKHGIKHQKSVVYTPEQNGIAERANRKLVEKAKCLLFDAKLDISYWAEAVNMAAFIINRSANATLSTVTPEEAWSGKKVDVSHLQLFGSPVMVHVPKQKRSKWGKNSNSMIFVGYTDGVKGYRCINPNTKALQTSRDVFFPNEKIERSEIWMNDDENNAADGDHVNVTNEPTLETVREDDDVFPDNLVTSTPRSAPKKTVPENSEGEITIKQEGEETVYVDAADQTIAPDSNASQEKSRRTSVRLQNRKLTQDGNGGASYGAYGFMAQTVSEPVTFNEAMQHDDSSKWKLAMQEEMDSLMENNTWSLERLPANRKAIKSKWVFKLKRDEAGNVVRHKARLVAKGCSQIYGIDYEEVYSPVVRYSSIRFIIALAVKNSLKINQMDAISAYLQGELAEEIYMMQPEGFANGSDDVCKLNRAIYGLKQSGRVWNEKLTKMLKSFGLKKSSSDPCVFFTPDLTLIVTIYVDDFLIFWKDENVLNELKGALCQAFKMKDLGAAVSCIGLHITYTDEGIALDQKAYISEVINRFGMMNANPVATPSDVNQKLSVSMSPTDQKERDEMAATPYQSLVGCLLFIAQGTRPDIAFAVNDVSRFNSNYGRPHWIAAKRILRYLKGTLNFRLHYSVSDQNFLAGYCDSDWASDVDKRRSCSGYVFGLSNGAVSWSSKRQDTVALSSTEAEYIAASWAVKEAIWLQCFGRELDPDIEQPVVLWIDNQSAMNLASNDGYNQRTKHIDVRYHHLREVIEKGTIELSYVPTNENASDVLTKAVPGPKTKSCSLLMGLKSN